MRSSRGTWPACIGDRTRTSGRVPFRRRLVRSLAWPRVTSTDGHGAGRFTLGREPSYEIPTKVFQCCGTANAYLRPILLKNSVPWEIHEKVATECPSHANSEVADLGKTKTTRLRQATFSTPLPTKEFFNSIDREGLFVDPFPCKRSDPEPSGIRVRFDGRERAKRGSLRCV